MRNALIRLAPCAVFLSFFASAQVVEKPVAAGTNTGMPTPVTGTGINAPSGNMGANLSGPSLQGGLNAGAPTPTVTPGAVTPAGLNPILSVPGAALPIKTVGAEPAANASKAVLPPAPQIPKPNAQSGIRMKGAVPGVKAMPTASSVLDTAAKGVEQGRQTDAAGGDGQSVRRALDRAYDSSVRVEDVGGGSDVAGKFSSAREKVAGFVGVANNSAPADAPGLYASAIKTAEETLPVKAASAVTKAVLSFAAQKAERSLSSLAQAAYTAASAGQASEARRLVKSLDSWEKLLGAPGRPLITNADRLKSGVESALADAAKTPGSTGSAPRVWVVKRGASYVAALPGTTVERVPGLAATFALDKLSALSLAPMTDAYRAFVAAPGARSAFGARVSMGESVPSAALSTAWLWLKYLVMRAWNALVSLVPGRGIPSVANDRTLPRLREAARAWQDAAGIGAAAARAAGAPRLTVSRARGAFTLARRAAVAHEALSGQAGAVSRIDSLSSEFEAGVKRGSLSPADRLPAGLESIVAGEGSLRHWSLLYASDSRERGAASFGRVRGTNAVVVLSEGPGALAATTLAAASKDMSFTAFGDALWASGFGAFGAVKLSADMRSTESGGSVVVETERGDENLAVSLDNLGFAVVRRGRGLRATLDAQTLSAGTQEMSELTSDAAALIMGGQAAQRSESTGGLGRLLADMKRAPMQAAKTAASLDGTSRLTRMRTVGWVGDYEAVATEIRSRGVRVIALRDPATGLSKFARIEPLRLR